MGKDGCTNGWLAVAPAHLFLPALYIVGRLGFKNDRYAAVEFGVHYSVLLQLLALESIPRIG